MKTIRLIGRLSKKRLVSAAAALAVVLFVVTGKAFAGIALGGPAIDSHNGEILEEAQVEVHISYWLAGRFTTLPYVYTRTDRKGKFSVPINGVPSNAFAVFGAVIVTKIGNYVRWDSGYRDMPSGMPILGPYRIGAIPCTRTDVKGQHFDLVDNVLEHLPRAGNVPAPGATVKVAFSCDSEVLYETKLKSDAQSHIRVVFDNTCSINTERVLSLEVTHIATRPCRVIGPVLQKAKPGIPSNFTDGLYITCF